MKANVKLTGMVKRIMAVAAAMLMVFTLFAAAVPAQAANVAPNGDNTFTFKDYLVLPANANVPVGTFDFSIDPGAAVSATGGSPAIYAAPASSATITDVTFGTGDTTAIGTPAGQNQKYVAKDVTVTLDASKFTAPGIYRYTITRTGTIAGVTNDANLTRTLDVYVEYTDDSGTTLKFAYYVLHVGVGDPTGADKADEYTDTYATNGLTLSKTVSGNQGDRDKLFTFTVDLTVAPNATYTVTVPVGGDVGNQTTLTANSEGVISATYKLAHNQQIVIHDLAPTDKYTITEASYANEGYTTKYEIDTNGQQTGNEASGTMGATAHTVTFENHKEGTVPTGVLLETAPYIALAVIVLAGFVVLFATSKRRRQH